MLEVEAFGGSCTPSLSPPSLSLCLPLCLRIWYACVIIAHRIINKAIQIKIKIMKMKIKRASVQNGTDKICIYMCIYGVPLTKCLCEGEADRLKAEGD